MTRALNEPRELGELAGLSVAVTCGGDLADRLAAEVRLRGGDPRVIPLTRIAPPERPEELAGALDECAAGRYDWVCVTSANGAAVLGGARSLGTARVAAVGPATAEALKVLGYAVDLVPASDFSARGLAATFLAAEPGQAGSGSTGASRRVLLPASEIASDELESVLTAVGHAVTRVTAYRTIAEPVSGAVASALSRADVALVASGSAGRALAAQLESLSTTAAARSEGHLDSERASGTAPIATLIIAAIGEPTARALRQAGVRVDAVASRHTAAGLVAAAVDAIAQANRASGDAGDTADDEAAHEAIHNSSNVAGAAPDSQDPSSHLPDRHAPEETPA